MLSNNWYYQFILQGKVTGGVCVKLRNEGVVEEDNVLRFAKD
ncbi:hypothetical protein [Gracilibacillus sp. JCM 18860]